ncbi:MAG: site-specific integrase [Clostridia bacterium]|nr:site-specific integrase [Clostridia bacterium]
MATYTPRPLKNGKINYSIQIKLKDSFGKTKFMCTTWDNPQNLTGKRLEKALHHYGEEWEQNVKSGDLHKLKNATFSQIANEWLKAKTAKMSKSYYVRAVECIKKISEHFGNKKFINLRAYEVQQLFTALNDYEYSTVKARVRENKIEILNKKILNYGVRRADKEKIISRPTLYYARKGEIINLQSAKIICDLLDLNFNEFFEKIEYKGKYRKETILKYKRVLSAIFTYAIKIELIKTNYASSYYLKDIIAGEPPKEIPILSNEEYDRFLYSLEGADLFKTIPLYILSTLGLRCCEVCGLKWEDVNFEDRIISIKRDRLYINKEFGTIVTRTKTDGSERQLYMCSLLFEKLKEFKKLYDLLKKEDKNFDKSGFIFCKTDGTAVFPHHLNDLLKKSLAQANCKPLSCHKIRHSWITRLISNGAPVNVVSEMAGHSKPNTTLKIYTHYCKDIDNSKKVLESIFKKAF